MAEFSETINVKFEFANGEPYSIERQKERLIADLGENPTYEQIQQWSKQHMKFVVNYEP